MGKNFALLTLILSILGVLYFSKKPTITVEENFVMVGKHKILVDLATTPAERAKGLMGVKKMPADTGMLFIFDKPRIQKFWMAGTYIPLDIIWLNEEKKVIYIEHNAPPCTETGQLQSLCKNYGPSEKAKYVLELNAGMAKIYEITNEIEIEF